MLRPILIKATRQGVDVAFISPAIRPTMRPTLLFGLDAILLVTSAHIGRAENPWRMLKYEEWGYLADRLICRYH